LPLSIPSNKSGKRISPPFSRVHLGHVVGLSNAVVLSVARTEAQLIILDAKG